MSKYKDFDRRKSIHVKLYTETHANFRVELMKKKLSMQEVFEDFAQSYQSLMLNLFLTQLKTIEASKANVWQI